MPPPEGMGRRMKTSHLLGLREIQGRDILFNLRRYHFHKQYEEIQASRPTVWKFKSTEHVCRAIERICIQLHTETGTRNALLLAASRYNNVLSVFEVDNPEEPHLDVESVWSPRPQIDSVFEVDNPEEPHLDVESVWSPRPQNEVSNFPRLTSPSLSVFENVWFPSPVSCVKQSGGLSGHVLVTTAGFGISKGSLYSLKANNAPRLAAEFLFEVNGTVWTVDCNSYGTYAALGTSTGPALLDLETRSLVRFYRTESDVLSLQFLSSGNVVLCGLRSGSILTFDPRLKQISGNTEASDWSSASPNSHMTSLHAVIQRLTYSTSAVCSMVSLSSDENYFIASSVDGSIKLFDIRFRNVVRSYREGHVNSCSHLPIAVNPSETLLLSGGEDCRTSIWSIKTGELLFSEMFSKSPCTSVLWPGFPGYAGHQLNQNQSSGPWLGSHRGLFYMHGN